jgi:UDP-N-acetylmuramyl pentapeptide phosphotransferase/UDP-N-acetylglucosamine-1-phosphate transferase
MERIAGRGALLDHYDDAGVVWAVDLEAEMSAMRKSGITRAMGETHVRGSIANVTATPIAPVRFWIITMMLVLFGLSTLKLR